MGVLFRGRSRWAGHQLDSLWPHSSGSCVEPACSWYIAPARHAGDRTEQQPHRARDFVITWD